MLSEVTTPVDEAPPPAAPHPSNEVAISKFNIFTLRTNQRIYKEIIAKRNMDKQYIEALEAMLLLHSIDLPEREALLTTKNPISQSHHLGTIDGSPEALTNLLTKVKDLQRMYNVQICFKDLGYWTNARKPYIPTVGTTVTDWFIGHGPKSRVDILKGLTGRTNSCAVQYFMITYNEYHSSSS